MARTYQGQIHLPPFSGNTGWLDGDGMSTRQARDLVQDMNNLLAYCDAKVFAPFPPTGKMTKDIRTGGVTREVYVTQAPIIVPPNSARMVWTAGIQTDAGAGITTTISALTVYLAQGPFVGADAPNAFDPTLLPPGYKVRSKTFTLTVTNGTTAYYFVDDWGTGSDGMPTPPTWYGVLPDGGSFRTPSAYLILTATVNNNDAPENTTGRLYLYDFCAVPRPE